MYACSPICPVRWLTVWLYGSGKGVHFMMHTLHVVWAIAMLLQVKSGSVFDNILLTDDFAAARKFAEDTWAKLKEAEKSMFDKVSEVSALRRGGSCCRAPVNSTRRTGASKHWLARADSACACKLHMCCMQKSNFNTTPTKPLACALLVPCRLLTSKNRL